MAKAQNSDGEIIEILLEKLKLYTSILEGCKKQPSSHLQKFYNEIRSKGKEEVLIELMDFYLNSFYNKCGPAMLYKSDIFNYIKSHIANTPTSAKLIINNFTKIIKLGFENENLGSDLTILIIKLAKKQIGSVESTQEEEDRYQYIVNQFPEISHELEEIKRNFVDLAEGDASCIKSFNGFINFIYKAKKNIEEQDKSQELERQKAEQDLLSSAEKIQLEPQIKKKKKKSKNSKQTVSLSPNKEIENDNLPQASNHEEMPIKDEKSAETKWSKKLSTLIRSKFPNEESKEFEEELKQAMFVLESRDQTDDNNQEIEQVYQGLRMKI